jgi:hypothetical protein
MFSCPALQNIETNRADTAGADPAHFFSVRQSALLKDLQVLRYGCERDPEGRGKVRHGGGPLPQPVQNRPAGGIAESMKQPIDIDTRFFRHGKIPTSELRRLTSSPRP